MQDPISAADRLVGRYNIMPAVSGKASRGKMDIERAGRFLHTTTRWEAGEIRHGLAMPHGGRLVMAFGPKDKVEIGAYDLSADRRTLSGLWVPPGASRDDLQSCGEEISERSGDASAPYPAGTWTIRRAVAIDAQPYTGTLTTTPRDRHSDWPRAIDLTWALHDGDYTSFGLAFEDAIYTTFSFEPDLPFGVIVYETSAGEWQGAMISSTDLAIRYEVLHRAP